MLAHVRSRLGDELFESLGRELQPGSTTTLLAWLNARGKFSAGAIPISIGDYVIGALCGSRPRMHVTHAIGMLDLESLDWHRAAFAQLGLGHVTLPQLVPNVECVGSFEYRGRRIDCYGAYGDQQCGSLARGATRRTVNQRFHGFASQPANAKAQSGQLISRELISLVTGCKRSRTFRQADH